MKQAVRWLALAALVMATPRVARADQLSALTRQFEARSGARLVFRAADLPEGIYYDVMRELPARRRVAAARIALREIEKYPPGYLGAIGMKAIGVFDGLASKTDDGFHDYDKSLGGYRYYGLWNGDDALVAAYYTDGQLPLTLHHEIFHHVNATRAGRTDYARWFHADDERYRRAVSGAARYPRLRISPADQAALSRRATGTTLKGAVSDYAAKSAGEDEAETARYFMTRLPDALLQMARHPRLAGSQRMLHLLGEYAASAPGAPDAAWFVNVALGRAAPRDDEQVAAMAGGLVRDMRARFVQQSAGGERFVVWGAEDDHGVNWTLRADLSGFGRRAAQVARSPATARASVTPRAVEALRLLARYHQHIAGHWQVTAGTERYFSWARDQMIAAVADPTERARLSRTDWTALAAPAPAPLPDNPYAARVDAAISDPVVRRAIRRVQPAAVRLSNGSGVNLRPEGMILTAAHVAPKVGEVRSALFPDGRRLRARVIVSNRGLDVALLRVIDHVTDLPSAPLAAHPPEVGTLAVCIGQPGRYTPDGEATGYQPFHVSVGHIRGFLPDRLGPQSLGRTKHDAWTYWGHSGSPIFDGRGRIIAMHNSWDSKTGMRHAVTWEALVKVLDGAGVHYRTR